MTNEETFTALEHAIAYLGDRDRFAVSILVEAHKAIGPMGQVPSWETINTVTALDKTITLYRAKDSWMAHYSGPDSEDIRKLFGTVDLPCAFTPEFEASRVLAAISKLNPAYLVLLEANEPETL